MTRWKQLLAGGCIAGGIALSVASGVGALASPSVVDDDTLDALREEVPKSFPGKRDLSEANEEYGRLLAAYGESSETTNFGTGSKLTGPCGGYAYSFDEDGVLIDSALDIGNGQPPIDLDSGQQAFTKSNPFKVDTRGIVQYFGFSPRDGDGPEDHNWWIKTSGISLDKGGDPNTDLKNRNSGLVDLANDLPVKFSALVQVEGEMTSKNQDTCSGQGWVEFQGNGLTDPVGAAGLALLGGGFFGLLFNARPAYTYKSSGSST